MAVIEFHGGRVTHRSLMNRSKTELNRERPWRIERLREDKRAAHTDARAAITARCTRDADLPAVGSFHG